MREGEEGRKDFGPNHKWEKSDKQPQKVNEPAGPGNL
jgi:hypothetical protein